jgi:hypothetical protein
MEIKDLKPEDLKSSLLIGAAHRYEYKAEINTAHYVWDSKQFVRGVAVGDGTIEIPMTNRVPNLFDLLEIRDTIGCDPTIYRIRTKTMAGLGLAFHNIPDHSTERNNQLAQNPGIQ